MKIRRKTGVLIKVIGAWCKNKDGFYREPTITEVENILKQAGINHDKVSVEFERVYETIYDCLFERREAA